MSYFKIYIRKKKPLYYYEASLPERRYLGCVFCNLMYRYVEGRARATCAIICIAASFFVRGEICLRLLAGCFKLPDDFFIRSLCKQADHNDEDQGYDKCRKQFVDIKNSSKWTNQILPDKYGSTTGYDTGDRTCKITTFPE